MLFPLGGDFGGLGGRGALFRCLYEEVKEDGKENPDWNCTHPIPQKDADQVSPTNKVGTLITYLLKL